MEEENFTPPSDAILVDKKKSGFVPPSDAIVKKKDQSKVTSQEKLWGSNSKPKSVYTTLVTDAQKKVGGSVSSNGKPKTKVAPAPKVRTEEDDDNDFGDYLLKTIDAGIATASKSIYDTPALVYDAFAAVTNTAINATTDLLGVERAPQASSRKLLKDLGVENIPSKLLKEKLDVLNKSIAKDNESYGGTVTDALSNGNYVGAAKMVAGSALQSAPAMAISMTTGGGTAGLVAVGITTAASRNEELQDSNPELSTTQRVTNAVTSGTIEATLGRVFTGASGAVTREILKNSGKQGAKIVANSLVNVASKYIKKNPVIGVVGEVAEEIGVSALKQGTDIATGIREEFDFKEAYNDGISSLGIGVTGTVSVYGAKGYVSVKKYNQVKNTNKAIAKFRAEASNQNISEESRNIFAIKADELEFKNKEFLGKEVEKLKMLPDEDKAKLNTTNKVIDEVLDSIDKLRDDKTLSPEAKKLAISEIYKDLKEAVGVKKSILDKADSIEVDGDFSNFNGVDVDFDVETSGISKLPINDQNRLNKEALASLNQELNPTGTEQVNITGDMVSKRASELYGKEFDKEESKDEARSKLYKENIELTQAEGSTYYDEQELKNAKIGDEIHFNDKKSNKYKTKVKDIVDGKVIFENGKTQDDISSYNNVTAFDAWFEKNLPKSNIEQNSTKENTTEPSIVVHGAVNGFGLQYSEGVDPNNIKAPEDGRSFLSNEEQVSLNKGESLIKTNEESSNGSKNVKILTPSADSFGRQATNTFEFTIPSDNTSTPEGLQSVLDQVRDGDLKGKELIDESVKKAKEYIDSNKKQVQNENVSEPNKVEELRSQEQTELKEALPDAEVDTEGKVDSNTNQNTETTSAKPKEKIDAANKLLSSIKAKLKSKDIDPELKELAKKLISLKPSDIENIDAYIETAQNVNDNIKGSTTRGDKLNIASAIDKAKLSEYVNAEIDKANEIKAQKTEDSFYKLTGLDPNDFTYEEMQAVINDPKPDTKKVDSLSGKIDESVSKMKTLLESYVKNGLDVFTGEKVDMSESVKSNIDKILAVDPSQMSNKDKLSFIDAVNDILVNGDSNKIGSIIRKNDVLTSVKNMLSDGIKAKKLKLAFSPAFGRAWFTSFADKKQMVQSLFANEKVKQRFLENVGVYDIQNGNSSAIKNTNNFFASMNDKYKNVKVNGESILSPKNSIYANIFGIMNMSNDQKDFSKFKGIIEKSISNLNKGNESNKKLAQEYKKVYDDVLKDSNSLDELVSKTDSNIIDLVNDVSSEYNSQFEGKRKVALEVYNASLNKKKNYIPLVYKKMNGDVNFEDLDAFDVDFASKAEKVYDKKSGTFIERTDYENISDDTYISLDFMHDNYFKMTESATDSNTAYGIQKLKTFIESKYLNEIMPDADDRNAFVNSMKDFVKNVRNRKIDSSPEYVRGMANGLDKFSRYGTIQALNKVTQVFNQSVPTMGTTFLNSGGRLGIKEVLDPRWRKLISESGLPVAIRGIDANVLDFNSLKSELEKPKTNAVGRIAESVADFQDKQMKWFLGNSDKAANWASWIAFYKKGLADQGIKDVDIDNHELNKEAANYAQDMVDKYQGSSLRALDGNVFTDKNSTSKVIRNFIIPLAKFSINQKTRLYNDVRVLAKSDSWGKFAGNLPTAGVSIASAAAEVYVFNSVKNFFKRQIEDGVDMFMGYEEDEEEKKKRDDKETKLDVLNYGSAVSPVPLSDAFVQTGISKAYNLYQDYAGIPDEERVDVSPYDANGNSIGIYEISIKRASEQYDYQKLIYDGKFEEKGNKYQLLPEDLEKIRKLSVPYAGNFVNVVPGEMNTVVKRAVYIAKLRAKKKNAKIKGIDYKDVESKYEKGTDGYKGIKSNYK